MSIGSIMPSKRLILCHPLLLLPSILPSIRVFSNELALHQVAKVLNFCFSLSTSNEYSGLISFRIDWFDLLVVQGILKSLLQHHSLKASILQGSGFFMIQLSQFSSVQFSSSVVSDNLWPHGLEHARPPCPKPTPRVYSNSCPQSQRCQATISSSVIPFSLPSILPSIRVFSKELALHIRWPKYWSCSFSISPSNEYSVLISFSID